MRILKDYQSVEELRDFIVRYKLLPTDVQIALTCRYYGISTIASLDEDFKRVQWLKTIS